MIFTVSDVSSLSQSLHRWEIAEYVSEAFVVLACAGELVADLGESWLKEKRKKHLERRSTILLVVALSISLICLVRTNELSGVVIGSLGDKAEEAETKAKKAVIDSSTALAQGEDALSKAGAAEVSLGKAEAEAKSAQTASSSALAIAGQARKEADSFEADIKSAKKQAAEAESHLADAMKRANALTAELDRLTTPRSLPSSPQVISSLAPFKDTEYMFTGVCEDEECIKLLRDIDGILQSAGWKRVKSPHVFPGLLLWGNRSDDDGVGFDLEPGIKISVESTMKWSELDKLPLSAFPRHIRAAVTLNLMLTSNVSPAEKISRKVNIEKIGSSSVVRVSVGRKPLP